MFPEEVLWEMAWRRAFGLALLQLLPLLLAGYIGLIVLLYRRREWSLAVVCTVCTVIPPGIPIGLLIVLVVGWLRARRWRIVAFMALWSGLFLMVVLNIAAILTLRDMDSATLRWLFGLDPG